MYCIGKASRYRAGDKVTACPGSSNPSEPTLYHVLRAALYPTRELAEIAASEAGKYNPVGFVVLELVNRESHA